MIRDGNASTCMAENVLGEQVEIADTPLKKFFDSKCILGTKNKSAKNFFADELIQTLTSQSAN